MASVDKHALQRKERPLVELHSNELKVITRSTGASTLISVAQSTGPVIKASFREILYIFYGVLKK